MIIVGRHAQTDKSPVRFITPEGRERSYRKGEKLKESGVVISHVTSSPQPRALETGLEVIRGNSTTAIPTITIHRDLDQFFRFGKEEELDLLRTFCHEQGCSGERAIFTCTDEMVTSYVDDAVIGYQIAIMSEYTQSLRDASIRFLPTHGGLLDAALASLRWPHVWRQKVDQIRFFEPGDIAELVFENGKLLEPKFIR